ncbi:MAG: prepilin-type N-terminal cleavage/methylation domain-containing protein [bacterium]
MRRAFTLIELLIVVAIIGILAAIAVPSFLNAQIKARVSRSYSDQRALSTALEMYRLDHNSYVPMFLTLGWSGNYDPNSLCSHRLLPLTTPTAYITTLPEDGFHQKDNPKHPGSDTYHYGERNQYGETWFTWFDEYGKYQYIIVSIGPDYIGNGPASLDKNALILEYHMSNGLTSRGDIARYGP